MSSVVRLAQPPPAPPERVEDFVVIGQSVEDPVAMWAAVRRAVASDAADLPASPGDAPPRVWAWRATGDRAAALANRAINQGATRIVILPTSIVLDGPSRPLETMAARAALAPIIDSHPGVDFQVLGLSPDHAEVASRVIQMLRAEQPTAVGLLDAALARIFGTHLDEVGRFLAVLREGLPDGTRIYLRGSAVNGRSYETGVPFDGRGFGSSDLDLVVVGDKAARAWVPDARLLGGLNTLPLSDQARWVAPTLDPTRDAAQRIAGRPVSLQSMAGWFLELRAVVQGQQYVELDPAD